MSPNIIYKGHVVCIVFRLNYALINDKSDRRNNRGAKRIRQIDFLKLVIVTLFPVPIEGKNSVRKI